MGCRMRLCAGLGRAGWRLCGQWVAFPLSADRTAPCVAGTSKGPCGHTTWSCNKRPFTSHQGNWNTDGNLPACGPQVTLAGGEEYLPVATWAAQEGND